jgi:hypothetical protein
MLIQKVVKNPPGGQVLAHGQQVSGYVIEKKKCPERNLSGHRL